jgi:hypothetical protein
MIMSQGPGRFQKLIMMILMEKDCCYCGGPCRECLTIGEITEYAMAETGRFSGHVREQVYRALDSLEDFGLVVIAQFDQDGDEIDRDWYHFWGIHTTYPCYVAITDEGNEWLDEHADW